MKHEGDVSGAVRPWLVTMRDRFGRSTTLEVWAENQSAARREAMELEPACEVTFVEASRDYSGAA